MALERLFSKGKKEQRVLEGMRRHIVLLCTACGHVKGSLETEDRRILQHVARLENDGDAIRREIIASIHEGAFLPYLRPDLCRFVEIVDDVFDLLEDVANHGLDIKIPERLRRECVQVAFLNHKICEMLLITFETLLKGEELREKTLAIRIYEKKIDDIKFGLIREMKELPVKDFWEGRMLWDFIRGLTSVSDVIEDASDHLQIIRFSMP
jgi:predicted phosphate transport protein (TIGR00153 family)